MIFVKKRSKKSVEDLLLLVQSGKFNSDSSCTSNLIIFFFSFCAAVSFSNLYFLLFKGPGMFWCHSIKICNMFHCLWPSFNLDFMQKASCTKYLYHSKGCSESANNFNIECLFSLVVNQRHKKQTRSLSSNIII